MTFWPRSDLPTVPMTMPNHCPMARAARSRSVWRWRPGQSFCSSTSRRPVSAATAHWLAELINKLKGHLTIVIIEHDMEFLFSLADDISVIHWGQVIARGAPAALKQNPWVESSNLGRLN